MAKYICPECAQGKHGNCNGQAWDDVADDITDCSCSHTIAGLMDTMDKEEADEERGFLLIEEKYAWRNPLLTEVTHNNQEAIRDLLLGRRVTKVADDHLALDDGTLLKVVPNQGGCSCSAGDYDLTHLGEIDNIITDVQFDYRPTGEYTSYKEYQQRAEDSGYYRIFVFAEDRQVNLLQVDGDDGNGYYGTGFSLLIRKEIIKGKPEHRSLGTGGGLAGD